MSDCGMAGAHRDKLLRLEASWKKDGNKFGARESLSKAWYRLSRARAPLSLKLCYIDASARRRWSLRAQPLMPRTGCFFQWQWHNPQATGFFLPPWPTSLKSTARHLKESTCWMNQATGSTRGRCRLSSLARGVTKNRAKMALTLGGVQVFVAFSVISIKPFRLPDYSA